MFPARTLLFISDDLTGQEPTLRRRPNISHFSYVQARSYLWCAAYQDISSVLNVKGLK